MIDRAMRALVLDPKRTISSDSYRRLRGLWNFVPKGLQDSAWGFNPRKTSTERPAPKGRQTNRPGFHSALSRYSIVYRPFRAGCLLYRYLGLKPQAESYYPFGIGQAESYYPFGISQVNVLLSLRDKPGKRPIILRDKPGKPCCTDSLGRSSGTITNPQN